MKPDDWKNPIYLITPFQDSPTNRSYAKACMIDSINRGESPYSPQLLYAPFIPEDEVKIKHGLSTMKLFSRAAMYINFGITPYMDRHIRYLSEFEIKVESRELPAQDFNRFIAMRTNINSLVEEICRAINISVEVFKSENKDQKLVYARHAFAMIATELFPKLNFTEVGKAIARDHAQITYYIKELKKPVKEKVEVYQKIKSKLLL